MKVNGIERINEPFSRIARRCLRVKQEFPVRFARAVVVILAAICRRTADEDFRVESNRNVVDLSFVPVAKEKRRNAVERRENFEGRSPYGDMHLLLEFQLFAQSFVFIF